MNRAHLQRFCLRFIQQDDERTYEIVCAAAVLEHAIADIIPASSTDVVSSPLRLL